MPARPQLGLIVSFDDLCRERNSTMLKLSDFDAAFDTAVVGNKAQLAKFVHEKTHARPRRSDHLRKGFLADLGDNRLRFAFFAEVRQQQEQAGKTLLARIEKLIDQILLLCG